MWQPWTTTRELPARSTVPAVPPASAEAAPSDNYQCGRYYVLWPQGTPRSAIAGEAVVFDTYSSGCAFMAQEVPALTLYCLFCAHTLPCAGLQVIFDTYSSGCAFLAQEVRVSYWSQILLLVLRHAM